MNRTQNIQCMSNYTNRLKVHTPKIYNNNKRGKSDEKKTSMCYFFLYLFPLHTLWVFVVSLDC